MLHAYLGFGHRFMGGIPEKDGGNPGLALKPKNALMKALAIGDKFSESLA